MNPIRMIGLPTDSNSSFLRGPAKAPAAIRAALFSDVGNPASESGADIGSGILLEDAGDLPLVEEPVDDASIERSVTMAIDDGYIPLLLGGDHSVTYPILRAVAAAHGPVEILHFDAHSHLYDSLGGNRRSHASPFARIMEAGLASRLVQVGIRTLNTHQREQAERFGVEIVHMRDFDPATVLVMRGPTYISIDLDCLDPAFAPGVSHHEPGGAFSAGASSRSPRIDGSSGRRRYRRTQSRPRYQRNDCSRCRKVGEGTRGRHGSQTLTPAEARRTLLGN